MRRGAIFSGIMHAAILLIAILGLPEFFHRKIEPTPMAMSVEILPISDISNVPNIKKISKQPPKPLPPKEQPTKKVEPPKPVEVADAINKMATPPTKQEKAAEEKPKEAVAPVKPVEEKKPEPKPEEKPKEEKKQPKREEAEKKDTKDDEELDAVLKAVKSQAQEKTTDAVEKTEEPTAQAKSKSDLPFDESKPLSMSEMDAIRSQIQRNWNPPIGAAEAEGLQVTLRITVNQDGTIATVEIADRSRYGDPMWRAAADSAVRAVRITQKIVGLPADKFGSWKDMEITFDPQEML